MSVAKLFSTLIALVLFSFVSAQEIYSHGYFQNEIPMTSNNPVIADNFLNGEMSVTTLTSGSFNPSNILITYHGLVGETIFMKKYASSGDLVLSEGIVYNNAYYIVGLINRTIAMKDTNRGAFSMVIDAGGNITHYEEIRLNGNSASVENISGLSFNGSEFLCTMHLTETVASGNPDYTAVVKINNAGRVMQIERINDYAEISTSAYTTSSGLYIFEGNNRLLLDNNLAVVKNESLQLNPGERVYQTKPLGNDNVYLFTQDIINGLYSVIHWVPSTDQMTRILTLGDRPYKMEFLTKNGASYYLAASNGDKQCHYQLNSNYGTIYSTQQIFSGSFINGCNSALICDQELISYSCDPSGNFYYINKSGGNWAFTQQTALAPNLTTLGQTIAITPGSSLNLAVGSVTFMRSTPSLTSVPVNDNPTVLGFNQNCGTLASLIPSTVRCNETSFQLAAAPFTQSCLLPNTQRTYNWSNGDTGLVTTITQPGQYFFIVTEGNCADTLYTTVSFEYVDLTFSGKDRFCLDDGDSAMMKVTSADVVDWNGPFASPTDSLYTRVAGYYSATAISASGLCFYTDSVNIIEVCNPEPYIFVPNAFTPDGDGVNDYATASMLFIENVDFRIYNRWGQLIYETSDPTVKWDGYFQGTESPIGVYAWVVEYSPLGDPSDRRQRHGHFCLVR